MNDQHLARDTSSLRVGHKLSLLDDYDVFFYWFSNRCVFPYGISY